MKVELESTDRLIRVNGVRARIWEGKTSSGTPCMACIALIVGRSDTDLTQFEAELHQARPVSIDSVLAFPDDIVVMESVAECVAGLATGHVV